MLSVDSRVFSLLAASICLLLSCDPLLSRDTEKHRVIWRDNPSTTAVVAWVQSSGSNPILHFGPTDFGTNSGSYPLSQAPDRVETHFALQHNFVRLTGLLPDTPYYYVIVDSNGSSQRFWFRTAPDQPSEFNFIVGGDSRNFRDARTRANRMVAKLRPMFVMFDGDMTNENSAQKWNLWLDDWELTTGADGRMTPIIPARGNHELSNDDIYKVFDVNNPEVYFANTIGGDQLRVYTLNSEINPAGDQQTWLENDLATHSNVDFKVVQYHRSIKPHTSTKGDRNSQYSAWAQAFFQNEVDLVLEGDAHVVFQTWPIQPSGSGDNGYIRNDTKGSVYVGSGTWGAPLRNNDDDKSWTRASGSFNQFKLVTVDPLGMQIRTIMYDNVDLINQVSDSAPFETPPYLKHWSPSTGPVITIGSPYIAFKLAPAVNLDPSLGDPIYFNVGDAVTLKGAVVVDGSISTANYYRDGTLITGCNPSAPDFECSWFPSIGDHNVYLEVVDNQGLPGRSNSRLVTSQNQLPAVSITSPSNGSAFDLGTQVLISANASDIDGTISKVEFFQNGSFIDGCQDTQAPFTCNWTPTSVGSYQINASTKDNEGGSTVSGQITIQINEPPNTAPSLTLTSPPDASTFALGQGLTLKADASDSDGSISKVEFFSAGNFISGCSDNAAPYECSWTPSGTGNFSWSATATDDDGATSNSPSRTLVVEQVNQAPTISITSPSNDQSFTEGDLVTITADASDSDGSIAEVLFFENANFISGCSISTPPYTCSFTPPLGNHLLQARAEDNDGLKTLSFQISITVNQAANQAPNVSMTSPSEGASFEEGSSINLSAVASDPDGSIAEVLFLQNDTAIQGCTRQASPYECSWTPTPGSYQLRARAQDDSGATSNSPSISIVVNVSQNQVPTVSIVQPANNSSFEEGNSVVVKANASDGDGNIVNVIFFDNGQEINNCNISSPPFDCTWSGSVGSHTIKARAKDNDDAVADTQIQIQITEHQNVAPSASITEPNDGQNFLAGTPIVVRAQASDQDGSIAKVVFFSNNTALTACTDYVAPYQCTIIPDTGTYQLKVRSDDDDGAQTFSTPVSISVNSPQNQAPNVSLTSPSNESSFEQGTQVMLTATASDPDGSIAEVDFLVNGQQIPSCVDTDAPYACSWQPGEGVYSVAAKAIDNNGLSSSSPAIQVTIFIVNQAPSISITEPSNGMNIPSGSDIIVLADAQDQDGEITRVEFFANGSFIDQCQDTEFPYNCIWRPNPGNYELQATAFDDDGSNTISATVNVSISEQQNQAPSVSITTPDLNEEFEAGEEFRISASASDGDGSVSKVTFFEDGLEIASCMDTSSPFDCDWTIDIVGSHELTALAEDNEGATSLSSVVPVVIVAGVQANIVTESYGGYLPYEFIADASSSTSPNGIDSYEWRINGVLVSTEAIFETTFNNPGVYGISLSVLDAVGRYSKELRHVLVSRSMGQNAISLSQDSLGYQGSIDNYIYQNEEGTNFGRSQGLSVLSTPIKSTLLRWDMRGLPPEVRIDSAAIEIHVIDPSFDTIFARVLNRDWIESESTWLSAQLGRSWELPGAKGDSDRITTPMLSFQGFGEGVLRLAIPEDQLSIIKTWIINDVDNHGIGIFADSGNDQLGFSSSESLDQNVRPKLVLYYTLFGVDSEINELPLEDELFISTPYPNPWTSISKIDIGSKEASEVDVKLYDLNGRVVTTLFEGQLNPRRILQLNLDASGLPGGIYIVQITNGSQTKSMSVTLVH